jgi:hypothetical protein
LEIQLAIPSVTALGIQWETELAMASEIQSATVSGTA